MSVCLGTVAARLGPVGAPGDGAARLAGETLAATGWAPDGLYVATLDAGAHESIGFWADGLERGLAFANPGTFPWTLTNSPTGQMARVLGVRGPTHTLVGGADALAAALGHALDDLDAGLVERAAVVAHDRAADDDASVELAAVLLARDGDGAATVSTSPAPPPGPTAGRAGRALADVVAALDRGARAVLPDGWGGSVEFVPGTGAG